MQLLLHRDTSITYLLWHVSHILHTSHLCIVHGMHIVLQHLTLWVMIMAVDGQLAIIYRWQYSVSLKSWNITFNNCEHSLHIIWFTHWTAVKTTQSALLWAVEHMQYVIHHGLYKLILLLECFQPDLSFDYFHHTMVTREQNGTFVASNPPPFEVLFSHGIGLARQLASININKQRVIYLLPSPWNNGALWHQHLQQKSHCSWKETLYSWLWDPACLSSLEQEGRLVSDYLCLDH